MKLAKIPLLIILPVAFYISLYNTQKALGEFHLGVNADPSYVYLINAMNIAYGRAPGHVDHPGTILQYYGAVLIRITYFFSGKEPTLAEDVLYNPEKYLHIFALSLLWLNALAAFLAGWIAYKITHQLAIGLYIQIVPFLFWDMTAFHIARLSAESLLWIFSTAIVVYCIAFYTQARGYLDQKKHIRGFALVVILGFITKITFAPFGLLPFFFLQKKSDKLYYTLLCMALFGILAMPALFSYEYLFHWIKGLVIKSGHYNSGEANFMSVSRFQENVLSLYDYQKPYFIAIFTGSLAILLSFFIKIRKEDWKEQRKKIQLLLTGFWVVQIVNIIFVGKHYEPRYALPMLTFGYGFMAIFYLGLVETFKQYALPLSRYFNTGLALCSVLAIAFVISKQYPLYEQMLIGTKKEAIQRKAALQFLEKQGDVLVLHYYINPSIKYALAFGLSYSRGMREHYSTILRKKYPDYLEYDVFNQKCNTWQEQINIEKLTAQKKRILLIGWQLPESTIKIRKSNHEILTFPVQLLAHFEGGGVIYELIF